MIERPSKGNTTPGVAVLVIDDSEIDRQVMKEMLAIAGYDVHELPSPIGATRKARELAVRAVIIDQNLPSLDGSKLATLFRNNAGLNGVRVILVSSSDSTMMNELARTSKADAFVAKQELRDSLVPTLKRLLGTAP
jgi:two-component system cell cycle response regulator DivK